MSCPHCHGTRVYRSRRRGWGDALRRLFGRWPFRCSSCQKRFFKNTRFAPEPIAPNPPAQPQQQEAKSADYRYRTDAQTPTAQIVVRAETQGQLDQILIALQRAVASYDVHRKSAEAGRDRTGTYV